MYPKCAQSFKNWITKKDKFVKIYNDLNKPIPCDLSLRKKLYDLSSNKPDINEKLNLYYKIHFNFQPINMDIGTLSMENKTLEIFNIINKYQKSIYPFKKENRQNIYLSIPNEDIMKMVLHNKHINYFSFITSVSNSYQIKNTKMSITEMDRNILNLLQYIEYNKIRKIPPMVKLYLTCINECPLEGKIDNDFIVNRILKLNCNMKLDLIVLCDTCGTLNEKDFEYIINKCNYFGIPTNKLGIHLHVKKGMEIIAENIIHKSLGMNIHNFDVALFEIKDNSHGIDQTNLLPNLSYDLYYKILCNYIINKA